MTRIFRTPFCRTIVSICLGIGGLHANRTPVYWKTIWLLLVLILRPQASVPTIYQSESDHLYSFKDEVVYNFPFSPMGDPD